MSSRGLKYFITARFKLSFIAFPKFIENVLENPEHKVPALCFINTTEEPMTGLKKHSAT